MLQCIKAILHETCLHLATCMIMDAIVEFVWLPYIPKKLFTVLQFPRPSLS